MVLSDDELDAAMRWVKSEACARNVSIIDKRELFAFLARTTPMAAVGE
jgi:hypothetical protein